MTGSAGPWRATIVIGGIAITVETSDKSFLHLLEARYAGFLDATQATEYHLAVELEPPDATSPDDDIRVFRNGACWHLERGDFRAQWDPSTGRGHVRQSANPYSIDAVLRIVHTLVLAREGGFLVHAASVVRNEKAFLFAGVSGAGKTTISRLAPPDVNLLTDEISYVRKEADGYFAYGTPFAGELAKPGENLRAPLAGIFLLVQGPENRIEAIGAAEAARGLLTNVLFFAEDPDLVQTVFHSALALVERIPVSRMTFMPDARIWELVR